MFKYILKRLGISIIVLFGVSVILYSLVRMMPMDYISQKFAAQINNGTMTQADLDAYKALYGLGDNSFWGIFFIISIGFIIKFVFFDF